MWTEERLRKIPEYKQKIVEGILAELFLAEICASFSPPIGTAAVRKWRHEDREFDEACADAEATVTDSLERAAIMRARDGIMEPVVSGGKVMMDPSDPTKILYQRRYSDGLMQFLLRGRRREVYGDKREVDLQGSLDVTGASASLEQKFLAAQSTSG